MAKCKLANLVWALVGLTGCIQLCFYMKKDNSRQQVAISGTNSEHGNGGPKPVDCKPEVPCEYPEDVNFRIILMTFNRAESLQKTLHSLNDLELDGDSGSLEIWIDRKGNTDRNYSSANDTVDRSTLQVARTFSWSRGQTRVHVHSRHVGIYGQWIDTWRPRPGSNELALLLEDDIDVSPYAYRWLKAVHSKYGSRHDIAGYTLQSEGVNGAKNGKPIARPKNDSIFLYKLLGSWGYAPHPRSWIQFQDWYHEVCKDARFHPYVPAAAMITGWYKDFEKSNRQDTMWTMWHVFYSDKSKEFTVYNNLQAVTNRSDILLAANRKEPGLHFSVKEPDNTRNILRHWSKLYGNFPDHPYRYEFDGAVVRGV